MDSFKSVMRKADYCFSNVCFITQKPINHEKENHNLHCITQLSCLTWRYLIFFWPMKGERMWWVRWSRSWSIPGLPFLHSFFLFTGEFGGQMLRVIISEFKYPWTLGRAAQKRNQTRSFCTGLGMSGFVNIYVVLCYWSVSTESQPRLIRHLKQCKGYLCYGWG